VVTGRNVMEARIQVALVALVAVLALLVGL
jgi:hypothetical protein